MFTFQVHKFKITFETSKVFGHFDTICKNLPITPLTGPQSEQLLQVRVPLSSVKPALTNNDVVKQEINVNRSIISLKMTYFKTVKSQQEHLINYSIL